MANFHYILVNIIASDCSPSQISIMSPFSSVHSVVSNFVTPWTAAHRASLSITNSESLLKFMSIELVMPSSHLILCRPPSPPSFSLSHLQYFDHLIRRTESLEKTLMLGKERCHPQVCGFLESLLLSNPPFLPVFER